MAYNSKSLTYPIIELQKQLLYNNEADVVTDCIHYNLTVEKNAIKFIKGTTSFNGEMVRFELQLYFDTKQLVLGKT